MNLGEAVSARLTELLAEKGMTQYRLYLRTGVPRSTIGNIVNRSYKSTELRTLYELCQGLEINLEDFFHSPLFDAENLEP